MRTTYIAALAHHTIASARTVTTTGTLDEAKAAAWDEFHDEFHDVCIVICDAHGEVATRRIGDNHWHDS